jgi:4-amino-4-deoxy-L-arabinose transferase-like glycosyltransferase
MKRHRGEIYIFIAIILVAAFFRLYKLDTLPPGLYPDEAMNGNNAIQAWETGNFKVFYPENNGREGLFINIQALSIHFFGNTPFALRVVSACVGILTVVGLYFLARRMFNWQIAALSSFLMAVSFWHVVFSRIGFRAIMAPLFAVWGLYFFWRGIGSGKYGSFVASGICWGLGMYTYISFRIMPAVVFIALIGYWQALRNDFSHIDYIHIRRRIAIGLQFLILSSVIVAAPLGYHFIQNPGDFMGRLGGVSIFASEHPVWLLGWNIIKTLSMFVVYGDGNWRHNMAGSPALFWPVAICFVIGFIKSWHKLLRSWKEHHHLSTTQLTLLSWFFIGLLPVVLSSEGIPHSLRAIMVVPPVFLFAGQGIRWLWEFASDWYHIHDAHDSRFSLGFGIVAHESRTLATCAIVAILFAVGFSEFNKYFYHWGPNQNVIGEFNQNYVDVAQKVLSLSRNKITYIVVNRDTGVKIQGIPMPAQTVMYLTDTWTPEKQKAKHIYYLTLEQYKAHQYSAAGTIIPLEPWPTKK